MRKKNSINENDLSRLFVRNQLKKEHRTYLTDSVKEFLELQAELVQAKSYD